MTPRTSNTSNDNGSTSSNADDAASNDAGNMPTSASKNAVDDAATSEFNRSPVLIRAASQRYPSSPFYKLLGWLLAFAVPSLFYIGPTMLILPPILYYTVSPQVALVLFLVNLMLITLPTRPWPRVREIFELWYDLFDFHHNLDVQEKIGPALLTQQESSTLLICCMHPHGVIPIQAYLWMSFCNQYLPASYGFGAAASVVMRIPLLRQVLGWGSAGSASRHVLYDKLIEGTNLFILPGGVAEIFSSQPGTHVVKAKRHGLMKLALQTGASLVPVYVFGGNDFYHQVGHEHFSRKAQAAFTIFWGQYGLPIPYPVKCSMVLGNPISPLFGEMNIEPSGSKQTAGKILDPTNEQVEELLERYMDALRRLFDQYKAQAGYPHAQLEIR